MIIFIFLSVTAALSACVTNSGNPETGTIVESIVSENPESGTTVEAIASRNPDAGAVVEDIAADSEENEALPAVVPAAEAPPFNDKSIDTATAFADYFVAMLNTGHDLIYDEGAMDSWRDLFDFEQMPVYRGGLSAVEYSENMFQFDIHGAKAEKENSATVVINLQNDEPFYYSEYTYHYPNARTAAEYYLGLLAEGDVRQLAIWLSVDGGPHPVEEFVILAEQGLSIYGAYDLQSATVTGIDYDNKARRFICKVEDAQGGSFEILLSYGDGLIMPARLDY